MDKAKIASSAAVIAAAFLTPELLFLNYMELQVSVLGMDLSGTVAYVLGAVVGALGLALVRKAFPSKDAGTQGGSGGISSFLSSILGGLK